MRSQYRRDTGQQKPVSAKKTNAKTNPQETGTRDRRVSSYYGILGVSPRASAIQIRRAYRELSKRYHPDTTELPSAAAVVKFQELNEAYGTLSNPESRATYDEKLSRDRAQTRFPLGRQPNDSEPSAAYLNPSDRPLSAGEMFALFILGLTFLGCLLLAIALGLTQGESALRVPQLRSEVLAIDQPAPPPQPEPAPENRDRQE